MATSMKTEYIHVHGGFVTLSTLGDCHDAVPVLYIHGGPGGNNSSFMPMAEKLAENRIVYMYNQLGGDETGHMGDEELWDPERYIDSLGDLIAGLKVDRLHVIGRSWGGYLAAEYLLRSGKTPIISLTMTSPFLSTPLWIADAKLRLAELGEDVVKIVEECEGSTFFDNVTYQNIIRKYNDTYQCRNDQISHLGNPYFTKAVRTKTAAGMEVYRHMWGPSEFTSTGIMKDLDITGCIKDIKIPVLLLIGEYDQVSQKTCEYYRSLIPGSRMAIIPDASQTQFLENFDRFYWTFCNFIVNVE